MRTGIATLPLHGGRAPPWLFSRMVPLARGIVEVGCEELGSSVMLRRLSDPFWFQALSCVLGFDWHSSGTTTVTCGALKEALAESDCGLAAAGGKGGASRKTPVEVAAIAARYGLGQDGASGLARASRMAAKVDSAAVQDGHDIYHHSFFVDEGGGWAVVQQGMCESSGTARRYHWLGEDVESYVVEPHAGILGARAGRVLDMTCVSSEGARRASVDIVRDGPAHMRSLVREPAPKMQMTIEQFETGRSCVKSLSMPVAINWRALEDAYEFQPRNYEELVGLRGVGPSTVRALALVAELVHGEAPSWRDPVKYSFAVGGKDGVPFPVDRRAMEEAADVLRRGVEAAKVGDRERLDAVRRLRALVPADIDSHRQR